MKYLLSGWNEFYAGWLACVLNRPRDIHASDDWKLGWRTAEETGEHAALALRAEIALGHIHLTEVP